MKKVLALILALCLIAGLLPMAVMAETTQPTDATEATEATTEATEATTEATEATTEATEATTEATEATTEATEPAPTEPALPPVEGKVKCYDANKKNFTLTVKSGTPLYITGSAEKVLTKHTGEEAPTDNYVKFEMIPGETPVMKATFCNFVVAAELTAYTCYSIEFLSGDHNVEIELIGVNEMTNRNSASIKYSNNGTMTITGAGSLTLNQTGAASGALWCNGGDLFIKNTTMNMLVLTDPASTNNSAHHAICSGKGNVTFEGATITSSTRGGQLVFTGLATDKNVRYTLDPDTSRVITVKDSTITATARTGSVFQAAAPAVIINSKITATKTSASGDDLFIPAPKLEGNYTAIAGLSKNADKPDKLKEYAESKLSSYTYFKLTPAGGSSSTNPDYNGNPQDGDNTALALFMTLMAVSAVSIAGVSVIGKKKHF